MLISPLQENGVSSGPPSSHAQLSGGKNLEKKHPGPLGKWKTKKLEHHQNVYIHLWNMYGICMENFPDGIWIYPLVNQYNNGNGHSEWIFPFKLVIFNSYVKLPEGTLVLWQNIRISLYCSKGPKSQVWICLEIWISEYVCWIFGTTNPQVPSLLHHHYCPWDPWVCWIEHLPASFKGFKL